MIIKARQEQGKTKSIRELEELQQVLDDFGIYNTMNLIDTLKNIQILEKQNAVNSKKIKALEIIKEKEVNVQNFKNACLTMSYEQYLFMWKDGCFMGIMLTSKTMLIKEEYELLKEVLL